jgi:hypothetical protein
MGRMPGRGSSKRARGKRRGARARSRGAACHWFHAQRQHRAKLNASDSCDAQRSKSDVQRSMTYCVGPADLDIQNAVDQVQK